MLPTHTTHPTAVLSSEMSTFKVRKSFVLVSTCLTWAKTKVEGEETEPSFTEDEYRRRRPHPNFKEHQNVEKLVIKLGKNVGSRGIVWF